jgi:hypothetical protein
MKKETVQKIAYRLPALAAAIGLSVQYLRKEIHAGHLRAYKAGTVWIVAAADAQTWLTGLPSNQAEDARNRTLNGDQVNGSGD